MSYVWYMTFSAHMEPFSMSYVTNNTGLRQFFTWHLMLRRWTRPHAAGSSCNNVSRPCHNTYFFYLTAMACLPFHDMHMNRAFRSKKSLLPAVFTRRTHIAYSSSATESCSCRRGHSHCTEQGNQCVNSQKTALVDSTQFRHSICTVYTWFIPGIIHVHRLQPAWAGARRSGLGIGRLLL